MLRRDRRAAEESEEESSDLEVEEAGEEKKQEEEKKDEEKKDDDQQTKKQRRKAPVFTENHLLGANGLSLVYDTFPDKCRFRGRGYEAKDLDQLIGAYRQWAYHLFPNLAFEDLLLRVEKMGSKAMVRNHLAELRTRERDSYIRKRFRDAPNTRSPQAAVPTSDTELESELDAQHAASSTAQRTAPPPVQLDYEGGAATAPQSAAYHYDDDEEEELQFDEDEMAIALQQTPVDPAFS